MEIERDVSRAQAVRPSVSAVIFSGDRLLLQRRADGGQWGLPGGSVEIGETVVAALTREVKEETGLDIAVGRLIGVYSDPAFQIVRYPDGRVWHYVTLCFECAILGGRLVPAPGETLGLGFFDPGALPGDLVPLHRIRIGDALARAATPFIR